MNTIYKENKKTSVHTVFVDDKKNKQHTHLIQSNDQADLSLFMFVYTPEAFFSQNMSYENTCCNSCHCDLFILK